MRDLNDLIALEDILSISSNITTFGRPSKALLETNPDTLFLITSIPLSSDAFSSKKLPLSPFSPYSSLAITSAVVVFPVPF